MDDDSVAWGVFKGLFGFFILLPLGLAFMASVIIMIILKS
jgi:hypothetical protein